MALIYRFLFPSNLSGNASALFLLVLRFMFGLLLMLHGLQKWADFDVLSTEFPDPIGLGSHFSLVLAIFAELFCSVLFMIGFMFRLVTIPMIVTMSVAFFIVHGGSISQGELAFVYLMMFVLLFLTGPGRFSVDRIISKSIKRKREREIKYA